MNCPPLLKEISDLLWPTCAQRFRTLPVRPVLITTRASALHSPTRTRFSTPNPDTRNVHIDGAIRSAAPVRRYSWSNTAIALPLPSSSNSSTHHTAVGGYTVNQVQGRPLDYDYKGPAFLSLGVLIGDGLLMSAEAINS